MNARLLTLVFLIVFTLSGCLRVQVATPKDPIVINIHVMIEHEIYVKADKAVEALLHDHEQIF